MSQEKVERNRERKANRKKLNRKKKITNITVSILTAIVCAGIIVWIGFSVYSKQTASKDDTVSKIGIDVSAINEYMDSLVEGEQ